MWADIYMLVFSYERGDNSMFYAVPSGQKFDAAEFLAAEDAFKAKYGFHRPLVEFKLLNDTSALEENEVGVILSRDDMKRILKRGK